MFAIPSLVKGAKVAVDADRTFKEIKGEVAVCGRLIQRGKKLVKTKGKSMGKLHSGGHVPKTDFYRLKAGELVLNKTQLAKLKKAKTQKTKNKLISSVQKLRPQKMKVPENLLTRTKAKRKQKQRRK
jgi:hypothetical protein